MLRVNAGCAHQVRPPDGGHGLRRGSLPRRGDGARLRLKPRRYSRAGGRRIGEGDLAPSQPDPALSYPVD
jgi:hypothetical protein